MIDPAILDALSAFGLAFFTAAIDFAVLCGLAAG